MFFVSCLVLEFLERILEFLREASEFVGSGRNFFCGSGLLFCGGGDTFHFAGDVDAFVQNLFGTVANRVGEFLDFLEFLNHVGGFFLDVLRGVADAVERGAESFDGFGTRANSGVTFLHGINRGGGVGLDVANERANLLSRLLRFFGEFADFFGNDCEAATMFTCAGSLDSGVESEQVGLFGNAADSLDDLTDFLRTFAEFVDSQSGIVDDLFDADNLVDSSFDSFSTGVRFVHSGGNVFGNFIGSLRQNVDGTELNKIMKIKFN